jgi:hypothetical protein
MKNGDHAGLGTKVFGIGTNYADCFSRCLEQNVIDGRLVLKRDGGDGRWHRENDMIVGNWEELGLTIGEPLGAREALALRTVTVTARVVSDARVAAIVASLDMATERGGPACLDGGHDTALVRRHVRALRGAVRLAMAAKDIRHLKRGAHARELSGRDQFDGKAIERARCPTDQVGGDLRVTSGRGQLDMSQQNLNDPDIDPALQKMGGKAVAERMCGDGLADPGSLSRHPASILLRRDTDMLSRFPARKKPKAWTSVPPISAKNIEKCWRQHRVTIPATLAIHDMYKFAPAIDRAHLQTRDLADPEPGCVGRAQGDAIA